MKRLMTILMLMISGIRLCSGQERNAIWTDLISSFTSGRIIIGSGHAFCDKWSAEAEVSVNIGRFIKGPDENEKEHWNELYKSEGRFVRSTGTCLAESCISFCFWSRDPYDGFAIGLGCSIRDRAHPDIAVSAGYYFKIWKGIKAVLMCRTGILELTDTGHISAESLRIGLAYAF